MKVKVKGSYKPPLVKVIRVVLEEGVLYYVSIGTRLEDWEDGGTLGVNPEEGGDIVLIY